MYCESTIVECVGANKNNNGRSFQFTNVSFIDLFLTDRRSLSGKRPKSACGKSSSCRFSFSAERNANTKAAEYETVGFSFSKGGKFLKKLWCCVGGRA